MDINLVKKAYEEIEPKVAGECPDKKTRDKIKGLMEEHLPAHKIQCDEENNPIEVVDSGNVHARVFDVDEYKFVNVIF